ncbi:MAG TPA: hypothetical protein QF626_02945 [Prochlorococcaceae cyanobacterium Fu_MAG_50]|nr:hypothetical protein [Prochlorococcaceae cyanobacterium Fu_MAG_50]
MAIRQSSSSGKPKSPRIQVVLPEEVCARLSDLADQESRTVSNMAKVLIQQGLQRYEQAPNQQVQNQQVQNQESAELSSSTITDQFRSALEAQPSKRLKGLPSRIRRPRP